MAVSPTKLVMHGAAVLDRRVGGSMSGYSTTPNLGLKKPTTGADDDMWGTHWNSNADALDAAFASSGRPAGLYGIRDAGPAGDGVTDDQPKIQAWLNTLTSGGEVLLEPGKWYYIHAAPLTIPPNITIRGAYNALDNANATPGTFFHGGGFLIDPALNAGINVPGVIAQTMQGLPLRSD